MADRPIGGLCICPVFCVYYVYSCKEKKMRLFLALILLFCLLSPGMSEEHFNMLRSSQITGLIPDIDDAYGVTFRDLNNDGHPDIYIVCFRNLNRLLINNGGLLPFVDRTIRSGTGGNLMSSGNRNLELGVTVADYDNDGWPDIFLAGWGKSQRLFRNLGDVRFENVTERLNLFGIADANHGLWLDANNDGYLDLYLSDEHQANRLFINQKDGTFSERIWTHDFVDNAVSQGVAAADVDNDGDTDLYVSNWFAPDYLLLNDGNGLFKPLYLNLPTLSDSVSTNSATFADFDNDADLDLIVAGNNGFIYYYENITRDSLPAFRIRNDLPFRHPGGRIFGVLAADFNNDGYQDIFITTRGKNRLYLNSPNGFSADYDSDEMDRYSTGAAVADLDNDGDLDLLVANKDENSQFYLNPSGRYKSVRIRLQGVRSNRDAIGARVYLYSSPDSGRILLGFREQSAGNGYLSGSTEWLFFGMAGHDTAYADIVFPGGKKIEGERVLAGHDYYFMEDGLPVLVMVSALRIFRQALSHPQFKLNLFLFLFLMAIVSFYLILGVKRYEWSSGTIAWQLFLWLLFMYGLFFLFRETLLSRLLYISLGASGIAALVSVLFSEHFMRLRRRHARFREKIHGLADRLLQYHETRDLFDEIASALKGHPDIKAVSFVKMKREGEYCLFYESEGKAVTARETADLLDEQNRLIRKKKSNGSAEWFLPLRQNGPQEDYLYLNMENSRNHLNQEDIKLIQNLLSQAAIALDNIRYVKETAGLVEELTRAKVKKEYVEQLRISNQQLDQKNKELQRLFRELKEKESQLIHSEKMASLGHLVAGISHELNNPISFIYANMKIVSEYLDDLEESLQSMGDARRREEMLEVITELRSIISDSSRGSLAVKEIVQDLKSFSRLDQAEYKEIRPSELIDTCLKMLKTQIGETVQVVKDLAFDDTVMCNPGQLNQVLINLMSNAIQAMSYEGEMRIETRRSGKDSFEIIISDSGPGIPEDIRSKIFDPFFTTKEVDQGTGLGLSVSHNIIKKHGGTIYVEKGPLGGASFHVKLPMTGE